MPEPTHILWRNPATGELVGLPAGTPPQAHKGTWERVTPMPEPAPLEIRVTGMTPLEGYPAKDPKPLLVPDDSLEEPATPPDPFPEEPPPAPAKDPTPEPEKPKHRWKHRNR